MSTRFKWNVLNKRDKKRSEKYDKFLSPGDELMVFDYVKLLNTATKHNHIFSLSLDMIYDDDSFENNKSRNRYS